MGLVPEEYHDFLPLFEETVANQLPPHRKSYHTIPLKDSFLPLFGPLQTLSSFELDALKAWLEENLKKGFIRASSSPSVVPILFVRNQDDSLHLYMNYRGLNEVTIKNRYPPPPPPRDANAPIKVAVLHKIGGMNRVQSASHR